MAQGYNPFSTTDSRFKREIILRPPPPNEDLPENEQIPEEVRARLRKTANIWLIEMPEQKRRRRGNTVIDQSTTRGGRGGTRIRLDRQRLFDWNESLVAWDFTTDGMEPNEEGSNHYPMNQENIGKLPSYISEQIQSHIDELHEVPEDDEGFEENEYGERVKKVAEHPTSESSELSAVSGSRS